MEDHISGCPQGMDQATLGAWRDRELPPTQAQQVEAHVRGCRACQQDLSEMDLVGRAIRRLDPPQMGDAIWRDVQANIQENRGKSVTVNRQKAAIVGGLGALAIVTVLTAVILVFSATKPAASNTLTFGPTATRGPTPTHTPSPTATPSLGLSAPQGQGWTNFSAVPNARRVAFAASAPLTGYICSQTITGQTGPMTIAVTHDGGGHWQIVTTNGPSGTDCLPNVNPINPDEVVMNPLVSGCTSSCNFGELRSRDGGRTWTKLTLPSQESSIYDTVGGAIFAGDALYLFAASRTSAPDRQHTLAVSVTGQPTTWIDLSHFSDVTNSRYGYGFGNAFYLVPTITDVSAPPLAYLYKTTDAGATWTKVMLQGAPAENRPNTVAACNGTGLNLVYSVHPPEQILYTTTDGGENWQATTLPSTSSTDLAADSVALVAISGDGTLLRRKRR